MPVINKHHGPQKYDVYVGRPSLFGNPYIIGVDGTRSEVIALYREWIEQQVRDDAEVRAGVKALKGKTLACWCAPAPCHADVLLEIAERLT